MSPEWFVGCLMDGDTELACGTFDTTYRFTAKYGDDGQINGRCQHPIVAGGGTGGFEGATGRVDMKDDLDAGIVNLRGHISLAG